MFRTRFLIGVLASALVCAASATAATSSPPRDQLHSFVCQKALDPPERAVSIQAVMRPVAGTAKMQMRFELMRQGASGGPFKMVRGRLLGSWISPQNATLGQRPDDVWLLNHPVVDLSAPATYRFRVAFRWIGAQGQQLSTAAQTSPHCVAAQPDTIPALGPRSSTRAQFLAPACSAGASLTATVDPSHTIDEFNFANNVFTMACPAPATSGSSGTGG